VVDDTASDRTIGGRWVVDASIMPRVPSNTTNVTTLMIAAHIARRRCA